MLSWPEVYSPPAVQLQPGKKTLLLPSFHLKMWQLDSFMMEKLSSSAPKCFSPKKNRAGVSEMAEIYVWQGTKNRRPLSYLRSINQFWLTGVALVVQSKQRFIKIREIVKEKPRGGWFGKGKQREWCI